MPVLRRVHAAQENIAHCVIKMGYKIKKGGVGKVSAMVAAQHILINHAVNSRLNRKGHVVKSCLTYDQVL